MFLHLSFAREKKENIVSVISFEQYFADMYNIVYTPEIINSHKRGLLLYPGLTQSNT